MKAVIQRVSQASVTVGEETVGCIGLGLLVLLGVAKEDEDTDVTFLVEKVVSLRIFSDEKGKMNRSVEEVGGALLVVSQFTLGGYVSKGRRPGFDRAAPPDQARRLYEAVVNQLCARGLPVETGRFGAMMDVSLHNDVPVTFLIDSRWLD